MGKQTRTSTTAIKKARKKTGLTQVELAKKLGISSNHYARIERGEVVTSVSLLGKIVKTLKLKITDVLSL